MLRPYIDHAPRAAFAASIALWVPATARTVGPVRPRKFTGASVGRMTTFPGWGRPGGGSGRGARRSPRQDDRQGREERVRVLHGGKCYTSPSMRDRVTRFADGAGAASRCRGPLVLEQLARSHPQRATQALDRIGSNQAEPPTRPGEPVNGVQAEADRKSTRLNSSHGYISYAV